MPDIAAAISVLTGVVCTLTTESGSIQERLGRATGRLADLSADTFPDEIADEYAQLFADLTRQAGQDIVEPGERIRASVGAMTEEQAAEIAERLLSLYVCLRVYLVRTRRGEKVVPEKGE